MIQTKTIQNKLIQTYRGTWDELMTRRAEFAPDAVLEVRVYAPEAIEPVISEKNAAAIALLQSWIEEDFTDDPEERRRAAAEIADLQNNLNKNRAESGERPLFPQ